MNTIAEDVFVQCFQSRVHSYKGDRERKPYHRNCSCALHKSKDSTCFHHREVAMMKKEKKPWYQCSLKVEYSPQLLLFQRNKEEKDVLRIGRIDQWMFV